MALKKESLDKIAAITKIPVADLKTAIESTEEVNVTIPEGLTVLTAEELTARDNNTRKDGITAGKEIGIKEVRIAAGIEEGVGKDPEKVASAIVAKAMKDAKIEPDKQVTALTEQVNLLKTDKANLEALVATEKSNAAKAALNSRILSSFPKNRLGILSDQQYLSLVNSTLSIEMDGDKEIVKRDGQVMRKANTQDPLSLQEAVSDYFTTQKWIGDEGGSGGEGGRGGSDKGGKGAITGMKDLKAKYEAAGKSINGKEFVAELQQLQKDNPDFKLDE